MADAIQKKVCMVGANGVGKTSLVRRFVESIFDERYLTNIGVKIDKKVIEADGQTIQLVLWDLAGEDETTKLRESHLRGASGFVLVADGTRASSLVAAIDLQERLEASHSHVPFVLALNKSDLKPEWEVAGFELESVESRGWSWLPTSAKEGERVEEPFLLLARKMQEKA